MGLCVGLAASIFTASYDEAISSLILEKEPLQSAKLRQNLSKLDHETTILPKLANSIHFKP